MSESNEETVDRFMGALNSIRAHLEKEKSNSTLDDLREAMGMRRKDKEGKQ